MPRTIEAVVTPEILVWARETIQLSPEGAAKRLLISLERLHRWETGKERPTMAQLRKMAEVYKRPVAVFYLSKVPKGFDVMRDFRRLPEGQTSEFSPRVSFEIRRARSRREVVMDLAAQLGDRTPHFTFSGSMSENPEHLAERIREYLAVPAEEQFRWHDEYEALKAWKSAIELKGVLIFQATRIKTEEMRGFSISEKFSPIIVLNGQDMPRGKVFTLLHEFTHLVIQNTGICDLHESRRVGTNEDKVEVYANHVAGAVLIPRSLLLQEHSVAINSSRREWQDAEILSLAEKYAVSQEAMLRRLVIIGRASLDFYQAKREEFLKIYADRRKSKPSGAPRIIAW